MQQNSSSFKINCNFVWSCSNGVINDTPDIMQGVVLNKLKPCENQLKVRADMVLTVCVHSVDRCALWEPRGWWQHMITACIVMEGQKRTLSWQFRVRVSSQFRDLYKYQQTCWHSDGYILNLPCSHPDKPQPQWNKRENTDCILVHTNLLKHYLDRQLNLCICHQVWVRSPIRCYVFILKKSSEINWPEVYIFMFRVLPLIMCNLYE